MELIFENTSLKKPLVSIVLLDWSVRESHHTLDYLNNQTVPRAQYEIIWIEYYSRRSEEIERKSREYENSRRPPVIDKWIVMDMPSKIYYHKHLMYNIGIIASDGRIVTLCDSDAVFAPTFVESVVRSFEENGIVLHMDEVRSKDPRFYPFNYPSVGEIISHNCINWINGKTKGLLDKRDPIHTLNYGACMSALREDLIAIGGADEHIGYLGHICGPYEMTFRLVNAGKKEVWHQSEFLYHTWHPGTDGKNNYLGPHDGLNMSQGALSVRRTRRIFPLVENPVIGLLRRRKDVSPGMLFALAVSESNMEKWEIKTQFEVDDRRSACRQSANQQEGDEKIEAGLATLSKKPLLFLRFYVVIVKIFFSNACMYIPFVTKTLSGFLKFGPEKSGKEHDSVVADSQVRINGAADLLRKGFGFLRYLINWPSYVAGRCRRCLHDLTTINIREVALFGTGSIAQLLCIIAKTMSIKIAVVYDVAPMKRNFMGHKVMTLETIKDYRGKIILASFNDIVEDTERLKRLGFDGDMIVDLW